MAFQLRTIPRWDIIRNDPLWRLNGSGESNFTTPSHFQSIDGLTDVLLLRNIQEGQEVDEVHGEYFYTPLSNMPTHARL
jgi:hypothetical protein